MTRVSSSRAPVFYGYGDDVFEITLHEPDAQIERLRESVVQDIWRYQRFNKSDLRSVQGSSLSIVEPGRQNFDAGPDFLDSVVRIDDVEVHGHVEVHITSSGWTAHGHESDIRYNGVILHVVLVEDVFTGKLRRNDGSQIEEFVLMSRLDGSLRDLLYRFYQHRENDFPCAREWPAVDAGTRRSLIRRLGQDRFREKARWFSDRYQRAAGTEDILHQEVFGALGFSKNADAMRELARRIPLSVARNLGDRTELEALHFGVAGLLPEPSELLNTDAETADYAMALRDTFAALNDDLNLPVMPRSMWTFFRLRPNNFPTLRIAQACGLLASERFLYHDSHGKLLSALGALDPLQAWLSLLDVDLSAFWSTHVRLQKKTKLFNPVIGDERKRVVITNVFIPFALMLSDGDEFPADEERIAAVAEALPAENDEIVRAYENPGFSARSVLESQGLHQLFRTQCSLGRCLQCEIGQTILGR